MTSREAFEAWWDDPPDDGPAPLGPMSKESAWWIWQAATERAAKVCEGEDVASTDDALGVQQCIAAAIRAA